MKYFSESSHVTTCKPLSSPPAELQLARSARDCVAPDPEPRPALANQPAAGTESCEIRSKLRYSRFPETLISRSRQGPGRQGQVVMCGVISRLNFNSGSEGGCRNLAIITKITLTPCYLFLMTRWAALGPGPGLRTLFKMFSLTFSVITAPARPLEPLV